MKSEWCTFHKHTMKTKTCNIHPVIGLPGVYIHVSGLICSDKNLRHEVLHNSKCAIILTLKYFRIMVCWWGVGDLMVVRFNHEGNINYLIPLSMGSTIDVCVDSGDWNVKSLPKSKLCFLIQVTLYHTILCRHVYGYCILYHSFFAFR